MWSVAISPRSLQSTNAWAQAADNATSIWQFLTQTVTLFSPLSLFLQELEWLRILDTAGSRKRFLVFLR